jgi:hypothetical protein
MDLRDLGKFLYPSVEMIRKWKQTDFHRSVGQKISLFMIQMIISSVIQRLTIEEMIG